MDRETVDEIKRHFDVVIEAQDSKIQLLAEGLESKIDRLDQKIDKVDRKVDGLAQVVQLIYTEVSGRLNDHETRINVLERREP